MIPIRTPDFWFSTDRPGDKVLTTLLTPLSWLYDIGRLAHNLKSPRPYHAGIPVLCIGNLTAGGGGKTPLAIALMDLIKTSRLASRPFFLSRGYGGALSGPVAVDPAQQTFRDVGDEPLLLARHAPTIVARDRKSGAAFAKSCGADLILLDDGFQNPSLFKDISFLVVDGTAGFGNGCRLPAGPLREPVPEGLNRADAIVLIGPDRRNLRPLFPKSKPLFQTDFRAVSTPDPTRKWLAFAGLGRPEKFLDTLKALNLTLSGWVPFPDHHPYTPEDLASLSAQARTLNAALLTTEKDFLRLPSSFHEKVNTLPVALELQEKPEILDFLRKRLALAGSRMDQTQKNL